MAADCVQFLQWALPRLQMRWPGFRKVRKQVCKRIDRRLRELGLNDLDAYRDYLDNHREEWPILDSFCRISISRFYRDRSVFDYLRDETLPTLAAAAQATTDRRLRCWSAGCASGEEAYTLSIIWKLCLSSRFPNVALKVIATDSDPNMLARAQDGCYPPSSLKDLPHGCLDLAFSHGDGVFCIKPEFRSSVEWRLQDIRRELPPELFDLILCRHLAFTYFDEPLQCQTLGRLIGKLAPGGSLVTGKQEPLPKLREELKEVGHRMGIYKKEDRLKTIDSD